MIEVKDLSKHFDGLVVLDRVSFKVADEKLIVILGPSGTGKTVLLKSMVGLIPADGGEVLFDGVSILTAAKQKLYEIRKNIGYVFQGTALFDSMNVFENIALPILEHTSMDRKTVQEQIRRILQIIGLEGKEELYPRALSGGMRRLVAIGRALALDPKYLFYDEPTTGLDPIARDRVVGLIIALKRKYKKSGIVVTHDLETARAVGDEVYMLKNARLKRLSKVDKEFYE
ncbi:hypothetical protein BXT86_06475 [candidate division WOR-3 bacterium 4484_100]|uniref:ABC transporter domain-containing protein n=1 Tax=candidate division WOR-3 bacterium 4484_100 TaxID=1936077 RepID=A0A1V4QDK7_UNCW3|nr:MAG: hypothetical protein BXT86_06475 [candidate division WOR-3 bacterium 4484_100]